ncbi:hypothetical protein Nepgr_028338 [Nepenthes gracilis]|uniref:Uncharacterized protein n=1 Tax=Nepenthes gracilis TaxID=150966 RepID=A0AAD3TA55_NEPGR|nr:hypothetical protein Nepgr_028338 [Nepenthes gracilis]
MPLVVCHSRGKSWQVFGLLVCFNCLHEAVDRAAAYPAGPQRSLDGWWLDFSCCRFVPGQSRCPWKSSVTMWQIALVLWCREARQFCKGVVWVGFLCSVRLQNFYGVENTSMLQLALAMLFDGLSLNLLL